MSNGTIKESPLFWPGRWQKDVFSVLDETRLPGRVTYLAIENVDDAVGVIRDMKTRAFGQFLVVLNTFRVLIQGKGPGGQKLAVRIEKAAAQLNNSRPTFPFAEVTDRVVAWAKTAADKREDIRRYLGVRIEGYLQGIREQRLSRVRRLAACMQKGDSILTHCNVSGELAMAAWLSTQEQRPVQIFATETRPYFQGARLTCWECRRLGIDVVLTTDAAVGSLMSDRLVNKVVVGSDRNCANGDFANKIGTYTLAVLAREFDIPFYVLTQPSTKISDASVIPVEIRSDDELLEFNGCRLFPDGVRGFYPGFDVVPHDYITKTVPIDIR